MSSAKSEVAGLVLIGGRSERMGTDKAMLQLAGKPLWEIAAATLRSLVDRILLLGPPPAGSQVPYATLEDDPPGYGPLGGIATGLEKSGCEHHLLLAVDYPLVQPALLQLLLEKSVDAWAVCGRSASFLEPLVAYYNAACAPVAREMLDEGELRTRELFKRVPAAIVTDAEYDGVDPKRLSQVNVNTQADMERVVALHRQLQSETKTRETGDTS